MEWIDTSWTKMLVDSGSVATFQEKKLDNKIWMKISTVEIKLVGADITKLSEIGETEGDIAQVNIDSKNV